MEAIFFSAGLFAGVIISYAVFRLRTRDRERTVRELQDLNRDCFSRLSLEALDKNSRYFLSLAGETLKSQTEMGEKELEGKKRLIDAGLEAMNREVARMKDLVVELEKDRENKFGQLTGELRRAVEETSRLQETAAALKAALADSRVRGQWGERMAEDVLRLAGFVEGINYYKQKTQQERGTRPDYTFPLPQGLKVHMDVKFPLSNYLAFLEAQATEREDYRGKFLRDVRSHIKDLTGRDYINPAEGTVDYVILFIPNEQVYAFINEQDSSLLDFALQNKVIISSPLTLYAILAVVRQAVDNFNLEKTAARVLSLMGAFYKQWDEYIKTVEKMGRRLDDARREYEHLTGTRKSQLEKPLKDIEELRRERNLEVAGPSAPGLEVPGETAGKEPS